MVGGPNPGDGGPWARPAASRSSDGWIVAGAVAALLVLWMAATVVFAGLTSMGAGPQRSIPLPAPTSTAFDPTDLGRPDEQRPNLHAWDAEPVVGTSWTATFGVWVCDRFIEPFPEQTSNDAGISTLGNGELLIAPRDELATGERATLAVFTDSIGLEVRPGGLTLPDGTTVDDCGGAPATTSVVLFDPGPWDAATAPFVATAPADARFYQDGQGMTIALLPADADPATMADALTPPGWSRPTPGATTTTTTPARPSLVNALVGSELLRASIEGEDLVPTEIETELGLEGTGVGAGATESARGTGTGLIVPDLDFVALRFDSAAAAQAAADHIRSAAGPNVVVPSHEQGFAYTPEGADGPMHLVVWADDTLITYQLGAPLEGDLLDAVAVELRIQVGEVAR
ncbi:MAG: hypothetical protein KDB36_17660 [Acidimicrobiales bacterium]|nr:hypothetical protein [Acidimicrobiales bacterium]